MGHSLFLVEKKFSVRILQQILQSNQQRAEQLKAFTGKLNAFMSGLFILIQVIIFVPDVGSREDALNETVHMNGILTEENARLTKEVTRLQTKNTECKLKVYLFIHCYYYFLAS